MRCPSWLLLTVNKPELSLAHSSVTRARWPGSISRLVRVNSMVIGCESAVSSKLAAIFNDIVETCQQRAPRRQPCPVRIADGCPAGRLIQHNGHLHDVTVWIVEESGVDYYAVGNVSQLLKESFVLDPRNSAPPQVNRKIRQQQRGYRARNILNRFAGGGNSHLLATDLF